jgi:hypothetical protein
MTEHSVYAHLPRVLLLCILCYTVTRHHDIINSDLLEKGIAYAKKNGTYEDGILTCKGDNVELKSPQVSSHSEMMYATLVWC